MEDTRYMTSKHWAFRSSLSEEIHRNMEVVEEEACCANCGDPIDADDGGELCMRCWREQQPDEDWRIDR